MSGHKLCSHLPTCPGTWETSGFLPLHPFIQPVSRYCQFTTSVLSNILSPTNPHCHAWVQSSSSLRLLKTASKQSPCLLSFRLPEWSFHHVTFSDHLHKAFYNQLLVSLPFLPHPMLSWAIRDKHLGSNSGCTIFWVMMDTHLISLNPSSLINWINEFNHPVLCIMWCAKHKRRTWRWIRQSPCTQRNPIYVDKSLHCRIVSAMLLLLLQSRFSRVRLCATHRRQPTRLPRPWDSPSKNTGVGCCFLLQLSAILQEYTKCSMVNMESSVSRDGWGQKRAFRVILELCSKPTLVLLKAFFSSSWIIQLFPSWKYSHPE